MAMTPAMIENQVRYFQARSAFWVRARQDRVLNLFPRLEDWDHCVAEIGCGSFGGVLPRLKTDVAEIGCGPFGGVLPRLKTDQAVGIDPLWAEYGEIALYNGYVPITGTATQWNTPMCFDAIVTVDTLQYEPDVAGFLREAHSHARPGAWLLIHLPTRSKRQVNKAHPYEQQPSAMLDLFEPSGWNIINKHVHARDPLSDKPYATLVVEAMRIWEPMRK